MFSQSLEQKTQVSCVPEKKEREQKTREPVIVEEKELKQNILSLPTPETKEREIKVKESVDEAEQEEFPPVDIFLSQHSREK